MTTDQGQKVKGHGHKLTLRISSNKAITRQRIVVSTLNLVETFIARGETCDALSKSVGQLHQLDQGRNMADFSFREDLQNLGS